MFTNKISVLKIVEDTTVDGPGFRTSIYAAGCEHGCKGCHNPESWEISNGKWMDIDEILKIIESNFLAQVSFSGGDPLFQPEAFTELARRIKLETQKNIWCYTGFTFQKILRNPKLSAILPYIDVLVDGQFIEKKKVANLPFVGSSNQRIINVKESLKANKIVEWKNPFLF
ncbi:anaerobic ribonucleoside-triphosphate reductase activating protein [Cloacibacterium sp.]|uniref:anaerobic ribonucleoside-triphosphate reductase activating protein n=1 Tax=Cloacibacterium sp. TaxID=1913682 RepID=UPI0035B1C4A2